MSGLQPVIGCDTYFEPDGTRVCTEPHTGIVRRDHLDAHLRLSAALASLLKEYPLRLFLLASSSLTPPAAFGGAHG